MKHTIYDNEIISMLEALDCLFCPQPDNFKMDDRMAYQRIFHTLNEIKERDW